VSKHSALIVWGGWDGHEPEPVANILSAELQKLGFSVEVSNTLDAFLDGEKLKALSLIVPVWTMGSIKPEQLSPVLEAVKSGVGIGGLHGGMCDSFRNETEWQFMTGGQWVAHPGNDKVTYTVRVVKPDHFIMEKSPAKFEVCSEQYYLHVDPANNVLATTEFPIADGPHVLNGKVQMPVVWTKLYGKGRVFYSSLGHQADIVRQPECLRLTVRGLIWAANAEGAANECGGG
jgi:type 1 glutamine amidotransferase